MRDRNQYTASYGLTGFLKDKILDAWEEGRNYAELGAPRHLINEFLKKNPDSTAAPNSISNFISNTRNGKIDIPGEIINNNGNKKPAFYVWKNSKGGGTASAKDPRRAALGKTKKRLSYHWPWVNH